MHEILLAKSPYGLIKEAEALIDTANAVNSSLLTEKRQQAITKIDAHIATLNKDIAAAQADVGLKSSCIKPLEILREQVLKQDSLAHITQAESEAVKEFDAAISRFEEFIRKQNEEKQNESNIPQKTTPVVKTQRVIKPSDLVKSAYLETPDDVNGFLDALRQELMKAIDKNERIQIR